MKSLHIWRAIVYSLLLLQTRTIAAQKTITVLTHGFQLAGSQVEDINAFYTMARGIKDRAGANAGIYTNDRTQSGGWFKLSDLPNIGQATDCEITNPETAHLILVFNWTSFSNDLSQGSLETASELLFNILAYPHGLGYGASNTPMNLNFINDPTIHKHFIGHSRGTVLLMQVLRRIHQYFPNAQIDHLTTLDPHPAEGALIDDTPLWGVASDPNYNYKLRLPANANLRPIVKKADNYFRRAATYQPLLGNYSGVFVEGTFANYELNENELSNSCYSSLAHSNIHAWYYGTVSVPALVTYGSCTNEFLPLNWYASGWRLSHGYNKSFLGRGYNTLPNATGTPTQTLDIGKPVLRSIFNSNFELGSKGWEFTTGVSINNNRLSLSIPLLSGQTSAKHQNMYFPADKKYLKMKVMSTASLSVLHPFEAKIQFKTAHNELLITESKNIQYGNNWQSAETIYIPIPTALKGKIGSFAIEIGTLLDNIRDHALLVGDMELVECIPNCDCTPQPIAQNPTREYGVTVIAHGFSVNGEIDPSWTTLANAVADRAENAIIFKNDPQTGIWHRIGGRGTENGEIILVFDWADLSNGRVRQSQFDGYLQSAADYLYASVRSFPSSESLHKNLNLLSRKTHFIGHSRGNILLLQVLHRMLHYHGTSVKVNQFTLLDPHPATTFGDVETVETGSAKSLPGISGTASGCSLTVGCADGSNISIKIPNNVLHADHYYRADGLFEGATDWGSFDGVSVMGLGTFSRRLKESLINTPMCMTGARDGQSHSKVHAWYYGTVKPTGTLTYGNCSISDQSPANWYDCLVYENPSNLLGARTRTGFYHSRLGGGTLPPAPSVTTNLTEMNNALTARGEINGIQPVFNGDFKYKLAGWTMNNNFATPDVVFSNNELILGLPPYQGVRHAQAVVHSLLYFGKEVQTEKQYRYLRFAVTRQLASTTPIVKVTFMDAAGSNLTTQEVTITAANEPFPFFFAIPAELYDKVGTFKIEVLNEISIGISNVNLAPCKTGCDCGEEPEVVTSISAQQANNQITLSWVDIPNRSNLIRYVVEQAYNNHWVVLDNLNSTSRSYIVGRAAQNTSLIFRIKVLAGCLNSRYTYSNQITNPSYTLSKQIQTFEYFFDTDPGVGNGVTIAATAGREVTQLLDIPTAALSEGVHVLHVRAKDNQNRWSLPYLYPFVKPAAGGALELNRVEYFLDTDPGLGNGVNVPTSQWSDLVQPTVVFNVPLQNVSNGIHTLHVRARDSRGKWSTVHAQSFARFEGVGIGNQRVIEKLEYFVDTDPGLGNGVDVAVTGQDSILDKQFNVDLSNVPNGIHTLHLRVRDNAGKWSNIHQQIFLRAQGNGSGTAIIQQMECFIDQDPGLGQAVNIPLTPAAQVEPTFNVDLSQVNNGVHALHVRAKDNYGKWSTISVHPFVKVSGNNGNRVITRVECFWDTDPGLGNATTMPFTGTTEAIVQQSISLASVSSGRHRFYIRAKDANERWSTIFNDTVHVNPTWIRVNMTVAAQTTRCGLSNGTIQITATSGTAPYEYALNSGAFQSNNAFSNLASGSYVVKIRDRDGYLGEQTVIVGSSSPLAVTITPSAAELNCTTNSITLRASTGTTYLWDDNSTTVTRTITTAGTYTVTVTDANGCTGNRSITITNNATEPIANITAPSLELNCTTGSIVLTASGGTYRWDNNATTASRTVTAAGTYTVTVTGSNGCFVTRNIVITSNTSAPNAAINVPTTELNCVTTSIILTASGGSTYRWNNNATTADRTITTAGTYTVTVIGTNGCSVVRTVVITSNTAAPTAVINAPATELTCSNPSIVLTAGGSGTYRWDNNATTADRTVTSAGNYTVTVTSANGCFATRSITITANANVPNVSITAPATELTCNVTNIALTASGGGTYAWDNSTTSANRTITTAGNYTVTVTSANGCAVTRSITITANTTPPNAVINAPTTILNCSTTSIPLTASGGHAYRWSNNATTTSINATTAGIYMVTVTGSNGCTAAISKTITVNADLRPTITGNLNICGSGTTTLTASNGSNYQWSNGQTTGSITIAQAGTYTVTVSTGITCSGVTSVQITNTSLPTVVISGNTTICQDSSTVLTASGGLTYQWSSGQTTPAITANQAASYTVTVADGNGCTNTRTVQTLIVAKPTANFTFVANSLRVVFTNSSVGGTSYLWNFGNGVTSTDNNPTVTYTAAGTYTVTLTVTNSCGSKTYQQTVVTTTAIKEIENALQLSLYPNPNDGRFTIVFKNAVPELDIEIQNVLGQNVWSQKVSAGTKQLDIELPNRSAGVYMVKFYKKGQLVGNEKLVVSK